MKKIIIVLLVTLVSATSIQAQQKERAVEKVVLTYIENFFENNFEAMNAVLHPRLSKRGLNLNGKINEDLPASKLKEIMDKKKAFPVSKQQNNASDIVLFNKTANAKLTTGYPNIKWMEYVILVNTNGKWKIIDIFWEYYPRKKGTNKIKKKN